MKPNWKPQYGYRRSDGWRQKVLYGNDWDYPRRGGHVPPSLRYFVSARRRWRTIFFLRSLGLRITSLSGRRTAYIDVEVPSNFTAEHIRRFVDHCHRSGLAQEQLGLPGIRLKRFSVDRTRGKSV